MGKKLKNLNKHGLSREIPPDVKLEVRKRCGFGCIKCGSAIYEYEHFDPEYKDAKEHLASGITLLCGSCHSKKTRGRLSKDTIIRLNKEPKCKSLGFSTDEVDLSTVNHPTVKMGEITFNNITNILTVEDESILSVKYPEEPGTPFRLSAVFYNLEGKQIVLIEDNEIRYPLAQYDVEIKGQKNTFRVGKGNICLVLTFNPPNEIVIERIRMYHKNISIEFDKSSGMLQITYPTSNFCVGQGNFDGGSGIIIKKEFGGSFSVGSGGNMALENLVFPSAPEGFYEKCGYTQEQIEQGLMHVQKYSKVIGGKNKPCPCGSGKKIKYCCNK